MIALTSCTGGAVLTALLILRASLKVSKIPAVGARKVSKTPAVGAGWINATLFITALCSYPFLFLIDRGNVEGVVWVFAFLAIAFFAGKHFLASALFLAAAVCIKPFPALLFFIFLRKGRYKEIAAALVAFGAVNLIALKALGPTVGIAFDGLERGVRTYQSAYITSFRSMEIGFDHSLFACVKQLIRLSLGWPSSETLHGVLSTTYILWIPVACLILVTCGFYFWNRPVLNQLFAIVLLILLLSPSSGDYTLVHLYLPWGVFMVFLIRDVGSGKVPLSLANCLWILIPCAVLMTPQSYLTLAGGGFAGQFKAVVMVLLLIVVARIDMPSTLFNEAPPYVSNADRLIALGTDNSLRAIQLERILRDGD